MATAFNNRLRQIVLLGLIILLALLLLGKLAVFLPGFLGAVTLYFLQRDLYNRLVLLKRWHPGLTAIMFILFSILLIALPVLFTVRMVGTKLSQFLSHAGEIAVKARLVGTRIEEWTGFSIFTENNIREFQTKAASIVPALLNSSLGILSNFAILFFLLYFLLRNGRAAERFLSRVIPLKPENVELLSSETRNMIRANAIGIPVLAVLQGLIATLGYFLFGVEDFGLWGFMTGICSLIPIVGTMLVWGPLVAYFFCRGQFLFRGWPAVVCADPDYQYRSCRAADHSPENHGHPSAHHHLRCDCRTGLVRILGRDLRSAAYQLFRNSGKNIPERIREGRND